MTDSTERDVAVPQYSWLFPAQPPLLPGSGILAIVFSLDAHAKRVRLSPAVAMGGF